MPVLSSHSKKKKKKKKKATVYLSRSSTAKWSKRVVGASLNTHVSVTVLFARGDYLWGLE